MKNLLSIVFVLFIISVYGQETAPEKSVDRKWVLKVQPVNYLLQSYSFEVERMLNAKNAVTLGIGIPRTGSLVDKYGINSEDLTKLDFSTMHLRGAYRHYAGNSGLPKGFYIEPYLKYQQIKGDASVSISNDETDSSYPAAMKADFSTLNAGFQMGVQFLIAKRIAIDFYFLGLEAGIVNGNFTGTPTGVSNVDDLASKVQDGIDDLPGFLKDKLTVTSTETDVKAKASSLPYPWLRGGINIGIAF